MRTILCASLPVLLVLESPAHAQDAGVTSERDVGLRAEQNANSPVVATVKMDEPFTYECEPKAEWCKVTLRSKESGWLERAAIRDHYTEKDLPERDDPKNLSEINTLARRLGFNYDTTVRAAARGDAKALKQFFAMAEDVDGAAAESYAGTPATVFHLVGDAKFAAFLKAQPVKFRLMVRNSIAGDSATAYLRRHFPETVAILFYREMTDWPSPNGRYAIRKVFSGEFDLSDSKVTRAELIEKESGKVLCDMTADDIGWGRDREGIVLWAPDSKRFAYMSTWMKQLPGKFSGIVPSVKTLGYCPLGNQCAMQGSNVRRVACEYQQNFVRSKRRPLTLARAAGSNHRKQPRDQRRRRRGQLKSDLRAEQPSRI